MKIQRKKDEIIINDGEIGFDVRSRSASIVEQYPGLTPDGKTAVVYVIRIMLIGGILTVSNRYPTIEDAKRYNVLLIEECQKADYETDDFINNREKL
jgi:hypothetical protein